MSAPNRGAEADAEAEDNPEDEVGKPNDDETDEEDPPNEGAAPKLAVVIRNLLAGSELSLSPFSLSSLFFLKVKLDKAGTETGAVELADAPTLPKPSEAVDPKGAATLEAPAPHAPTTGVASFAA